MRGRKPECRSGQGVPERPHLVVRERLARPLVRVLREELHRFTAPREGFSDGVVQAAGDRKMRSEKRHVRLPHGYELNASAVSEFFSCNRAWVIQTVITRVTSDVVVSKRAFPSSHPR